ncbi:hypothetical protein DFQ26_003557 [Actinomortierella ambigua]|nr:hypothetical protein DFQ26_003557 [Actinomortierella ambigua]
MTLFDIAELREQVALNLQRADLLSCLRVSKAWHTWFIPMVYRNLLLTRRYLSDTKKRASLVDDLRRYGMHVRQLTQFSKGYIFIDDDSEDPDHFLCDGAASTYCNRLTSVFLYIQSNPSMWQSLLRLFQNNPSLTSVHLEGWESPHVNFGIANLFHHTHNLRHLGLNPLRKLSSTTVDRVFSLCPRLESLTLYSINNIVMTDSNRSDTGGRDVNEGGSNEKGGILTMPRLPAPTASSASVEMAINNASPAQPHLTRLRKLVVSVHLTAPYLPRLLGLCSYMTHLRLTEAWINCLAADPAIYLDTLSLLPATLISLEVVSLQSFGDEHLATLLRCMPTSLKRIALLDVQVGPQTIEAIVACHRTTLETLKLKCKHHHILGPNVASILNLCPMLRSIQIDGPQQHPLHIPIDDLVHSPWACKNLEVFRIAVGVEHESAVTSPSYIRRERAVSHDGDSGGGVPITRPEAAFYHQLGQLHSLVEVSFACRCPIELDHGRGRMAISWTLSHGLASLASLKRLRYLELEEFPPRGRFATVNGPVHTIVASGGGQEKRNGSHKDGNKDSTTMSEGAQSLHWMQQNLPQLRQFNCPQLTPTRQSWIQGQLRHVTISTVRNWRE